MKLNKRNVLLSLVSLFAVSLGISSCGSDNKPAEGGDSSKTVEVLFWHTFSKDQAKQIDRLCKNFEKIIKEKDNVNVKVTTFSPGDYTVILEQITKGFTTGTYPTLAVAYPDHVANYLAKEQYDEQYVVNLDKYINDPVYGMDKEKHLCDVGYNDIVTSFAEEGVNYLKEGTYTLPFMKSTEIMTYNLDLVAAALYEMGEKGLVDKNIDPEVYMDNITWNEFMELASYIDQNRESPLLNFGTKGDKKHYVFGYESDANLYISQSYQRNIPYIGVEGEGVNAKGKVLFNNPEAKEMMKDLNRLHQEQILLTKRTNNKNYVSNKFKANEIVFNVGSSGGAGFNDPGKNFTPGNCVVPAYTGAKEAGRDKYVSQGPTLTLLNRHSTNKEVDELQTLYGWKLMKYLTNTDNSVDATIYSNGYVPARTSSYNTEFYQTYMNENRENDMLPRCANIVVNKVGDRYFNYPVFKGSAQARVQAENITFKCLSEKDLTDEKLDKIFADAAAEVLKAM